MWASVQDLVPDNLKLGDKFEEAPVPVTVTVLCVYKFA